MNQIGSLIQHFRNEKGLSREKLARDICTEKYVYLVEKGQRTPSTEIVYLFGEKLGVDFFEYYEYIDCENPEIVRDYVKKFNRFRRNSDFMALKELTAEAREMPDFQQVPWLYEIELNDLMEMAYNQLNYHEAITAAKDKLTDMDKKYMESIYAVYFYTLITHSSQLMGNFNESQEALAKAEAILQNKSNIEKYEAANISVQISKLLLYYHMEKFEETIQIGEDLYRYQKLVNQYERIHYTFFYLAFAYYKMGLERETGMYFLKGIAMLIIEYRPIDAHFIGTQPAFIELAANMTLNHDCVGEFNKIYAPNLSTKAEG